MFYILLTRPLISVFVFSFFYLLTTTSPRTFGDFHPIHARGGVNRGSPEVPPPAYMPIPAHSRSLGAPIGTVFHPAGAPRASSHGGA